MTKLHIQLDGKARHESEVAGIVFSSGNLQYNLNLDAKVAREVRDFLDNFLRKASEAGSVGRGPNSDTASS